MEDTAAVYDTDVTLTANTFTKTGYTFDGWNTAPAGTGTSYTDGANVSNLTAVNGATVTLYAQWMPNQYTVSFDTQTDDVTDPAAQTVTFGQKYGTLPVLQRTGYNFSGWTTTPTGNQYVTSGSIVKTAGNHMLYAQWGAKTYTVRYHAKLRLLMILTGMF